MRLTKALVPLFWVVFAASGCAGRQAGPNGPGEATAVTAGGAAGTAAAAGVIWAAGGGCRLQGCPYGSYCNRDTGLCDVRKCSQGCPSGTVCNEGLDRCQGPSPANTPNDRLPQDDRIRNPPGSH